ARGDAAGRLNLAANAPGGAGDLRRLWVADRKAATQLTDVAPLAFAWWPDSRRAVYVKGDGSLWWKKTDGSPEEQLRPAGSLLVNAGQLSVAPNGRMVVWSGRTPGAQGPLANRITLWALTGIDPNAPAGGGGMQIQPLLDVNTGGSFPRVSPDGQMVAY